MDGLPGCRLLVAAAFAQNVLLRDPLIRSHLKKVAFAETCKVLGFKGRLMKAGISDRD